MADLGDSSSSQALARTANDDCEPADVLFRLSFVLAPGYWAVLTALIVTQSSVGGSLKAALDRFIVYRPQLMRHRVRGYAASAAG